MGNLGPKNNELRSHSNRMNQFAASIRKSWRFKRNISFAMVRTGEHLRRILGAVQQHYSIRVGKNQWACRGHGAATSIETGDCHRSRPQGASVSAVPNDTNPTLTQDNTPCSRLLRDLETIRACRANLVPENSRFSFYPCQMHTLHSINSIECRWQG